MKPETNRTITDYTQPQNLYMASNSATKSGAWVHHRVWRTRERDGSPGSGDIGKEIRMAKERFRLQGCAVLSCRGWAGRLLAAPLLADLGSNQLIVDSASIEVNRVNDGQRLTAGCWKLLTMLMRYYQGERKSGALCMSSRKMRINGNCIVTDGTQGRADHYTTRLRL